jgi:beta-lactamase regulating signal transducer with metallopeptidase domain
MTLIAAVCKLISAPLLRRYRPRWCYAAWVVILLGLIVPFRPAVGVPLVELPVMTADSAMAVSPNITMTKEAAIPNFPAPGAGNPVSVPVKPQPAVFPVWTLCFALWSVGVCVFLALHIIRHMRFLRAVKRWSFREIDIETAVLLQILKSELGIRSKVRIIMSDCAGVPLMTGLLRPCIVLPSLNYDSGELSAILTHELTHLRRGDLWIKLLTILATAMHWFNPALRLLLREIATVCELACDDTVMRSACIDERESYSEALISSARAARIPTSFSTAFASGTGKLKRRIVSVMNTGRRKPAIAFLLLVAVMILTSGALLAVSGTEDDIDYLGYTFRRATFGGELVAGDVRTDHLLELPDSYPAPELFGEQEKEIIGAAYISELRYRYPIAVSRKDSGGTQIASTLYFDYDFWLLDTVTYDELNRIIGEYIREFEAALDGLALSGLMNEDTMYSMLSAYREYVLHGIDPRVILKYMPAGFAGDVDIALPVGDQMAEVSMPVPVRLLDGEPVVEYPRNENGQTYGGISNPGPGTTRPPEPPDLIAAEGIGGTHGYVLKSDISGHGPFEAPNNPDEAMEYMRKMDELRAEQRAKGAEHLYYIPLYASDGVTVIGQFGVGNVD